MYPFDAQVSALESHHRIVIPDRTGYGGSGPLAAQPIDFHQRAAEETMAVLDALHIERAVFWGHSDGAVIALRLAIHAPSRVAGVIAEATHFWRRKPHSREFFETMRDRPDDLGARVVETLEREHGDRWRRLIQMNGEAWLRIADESAPGADLYDGRLPEITAPVLVIHGGRDPRTEPGELAALSAALEHQPIAPRKYSTAFEDGDGGHSPHSERATSELVTKAASAFLTAVTAG